MHKSLSEALKYLNHDGETAIEVYKGSSATIKDILKTCIDFRFFSKQLDLSNSTRISVVTENLLCQALIGLAIFEYCTLAPVNTELSVEQIKYYLKLLRVDYIMTDELLGDVYDSAVELGLGVIKFESSEEDDKDIKFELVTRNKSHRSANSDSKGRIAFITTTSGTTSTPKIVPTYYETLIDLEQDVIKYYGFNKNDVFLNYSKAFRRTFYRNILMSVFSGSKVIINNGFIHKEILNIIKEKNVTWFTAAPAVLI